MKALSDRLDPLASSVQTFAARLSGWESKLASAQAAAESARNALQQEIKEAQKDETARAERARVATETRLQTISDQIDELSKELKKASSSAAVSDLREALDRIAGVQKNMGENLQSHINRIEELSAESAQIQQRLTAMSNDRTLAEQFSEFGERLGELERRKVADLPTASPPEQTGEPATYDSDKLLDFRPGHTAGRCRRSQFNLTSCFDTITDSNPGLADVRVSRSGIPE